MDSEKGGVETKHLVASDVKEGQSGQNLKALASFSRPEMFIRADKFDLKSLDIQLEHKLSKVWINSGCLSQKGSKQEWEIDPSKLNIRYVVAKGTYGTVYRGIYEGQDVAGI